MKRSKLKEFILEVVVQEMSKIGMGQGYRWKEDIYELVSQEVIAIAGSVHSQEEFQKTIDIAKDTVKQAVVDTLDEKTQEDIDNTLEMVARTLYQVPYEIFMQANKAG